MQVGLHYAAAGSPVSKDFLRATRAVGASVILAAAVRETHATRLAQSLGIALAGLCQIHDPACQHVVGEVAAISKPKGDQGHFKCEAHDPDRLRVEFLAI